MRDSYFGLTDTGRVRSNNEDAVIAQPVFDNQMIMACVIDGVGGYSGGEVAAAIAKDTLLELFANKQSDITAQMKNAFSVANDRIAKAKLTSAENDSMACVLTLVLADIENNSFHYAHVGDTRLYLFRDATLVKVSKDHSFVGFLEDTGRLTEEAAMMHPKRNEINKALGFGSGVTTGEDYIETGESPFLPGDLLLLCSDGLTDMINKAEITALLSESSPLEQKAAKLVAAANEKGGKDNITVALVTNNKKPVQQKATKPAVVKKNDQPKDEVISSTEETPAAPPVKKKNNGAMLALSILCIALLAALSWSLWKLNNSSEVRTLITTPERSKNEAEINLQNLIAHSVSDTLLLTDSLFGEMLMLSDTIVIDRPSLYLKGAGITGIAADSGYLGPAIFITENNKSLILDSLLFENFDVVMSAPHRNIALKNTRFNQCRIGVASYTSFPEVLYVNGVLSDSLFTTDSLPKIWNR